MQIDDGPSWLAISKFYDVPYFQCSLSFELFLILSFSYWLQTFSLSTISTRIQLKSKSDKDLSLQQILKRVLSSMHLGDALVDGLVFLLDDDSLPLKDEYNFSERPYSFIGFLTYLVD